MLFFFAAAFLLSLMGSLPFSMINLNVLSAAVYRGVSAALWMSFGAVLVEGLQLFLILHGYQWLSQNPQFDRTLHTLALPIFIILGFYFFFTKPRIQVQYTNRKSPFFRGVGLSVLNVLVYPFWLFWLAWLDFPVEELRGWRYFISGAILGAMASLIGFIYLGKLITSRSQVLTSYINRIIASIFFLLALREVWLWYHWVDRGAL
jgi:threonine/homoserine/homoserine lactone efflux protein